MDPNRYRFRTAWALSAGPDAAYAVLEDLGGYSVWWPGVSDVRQLDEVSCTMRVQARLPYALDVVLHQSRRDPTGRVLEAAMTGDLEGYSRWTIDPGPGGGATATFEEDVVARKPLLRRLVLVGRPIFRVNHRLMMRDGQTGLTAYLRAQGGATQPAGALLRS